MQAGVGPTWYRHGGEARWLRVRRLPLYLIHELGVRILPGPPWRRSSQVQLLASHALQLSRMKGVRGQALASHTSNTADSCGLSVAADA